MRLFIILSCLCLSISSYGQSPPIPNLPYASLEDAGFNRDSIGALIPIIDNFQQRDFRGLVVPEENMVIALTSSAYGQWYGHTRAYAILVKVLSALE